MAVHPHAADAPGRSSDRRRGANITDARAGASRDQASRQKRYLLTMGFRVVCFVSMVFVHGWLRWTLLGLAVVLPYIAVILANQANERTQPSSAEHPGDPGSAHELPIGPSSIIAGDIDDERDQDTRR